MDKDKPRELPLLKGCFIDHKNEDLYQQENSWLIEVITIASENYGYGKESEYQAKLNLLKNNPIYGLSRQDLFWLADKFARVFAKVKGSYDYYYYHKYFFLIFFGKEKKKYPDSLLWTKTTYSRLENQALERPNPNEPIFFNSGASSLSDFMGYVLAKKPVGVQIQLCSENVKKLMLNYNAQEGRLFVDTGAFSAFRKGKEVDFDKLFRNYFELVEKITKAELVSLVAPDIVGNQQASLDLLKKYKKEIYKLICLGVDLIVPIQLGKLSLVETYQKAIDILGTKAFRVGLPSNEKAVKLEEVLAFVSSVQPKQIHLLGLAITKFDSVVAQVKAIAPNTHVSADATTLRAKLKKGSKLRKLIEIKTNQAVVESLSKGNNFISYNSLVDGIFNQPDFLSKNHAKQLARLITSKAEEQDRIVNVAMSRIKGNYNGSRFGDLLDKFYKKEVVSQALQKFGETLAKRMVSGKVRTTVISQMHTKTPSI